jgi:tRNA(Ile)-lysidine synthase
VPKRSSLHKLEERVLKSIRSPRMLAAGDRVGVAVSGGADSVALLRILLNIRAELGVKLLVVHLDHCLRGAESDQDMQFVADLAKANKLEFFSERQDIKAIAAANKWNLEDAARRIRYAFFERMVQEGHAERIAVAHTQDDQAETVLAHILRGTGLTGLGGIHPTVGSIVRPLLAERRLDLREYLQKLGQPWREDATNLEESRMRARIRHRLLPLIERDFSPQATTHLATLSDLAREEEIFWRALVEDRFHALTQRQGDSLRIAIPGLLAPLDLSSPTGNENAQTLLALTERLIRRLYQEAAGNRSGLAAEHVRQVIHLAAESSSGHRVELPGGVVVERVFADLIFSRRPRAERSRRHAETNGVSAAYKYVVTLPASGAASVSVPELKRRFALKMIDWSSGRRDTKRESTALDADRLRAPLVLRNWRPGDAYRAKGRRQVQKLKAMFLARRVPISDRASWPVLESAGQVAWAFDMPPADDFCASQATRVGVVIEEESI